MLPPTPPAPYSHHAIGHPDSAKRFVVDNKTQVISIALTILAIGACLWMAGNILDHEWLNLLGGGFIVLDIAFCAISICKCKSTEPPAVSSGVSGLDPRPLSDIVREGQQWEMVRKNARSLQQNFSGSPADREILRQLSQPSTCIAYTLSEATEHIERMRELSYQQTLRTLSNITNGIY